MQACRCSCSLLVPLFWQRHVPPRCLHSLLHKFQMQWACGLRFRSPPLQPPPLHPTIHLCLSTYCSLCSKCLSTSSWGTIPSRFCSNHVLLWGAIFLHFARVALLLSMNWKATLFPVVPPFRHRWLLKRIWPHSPSKFRQEEQPGSSRNVHPLQNTHREGQAF